MRVAVLGLGSIGTRHARNLIDLGHEVVGFDPGTAGPADGVTRSATLTKALSLAEAVVVASPTSMHAEHAIASIESNLPVLVEKPLAVDPRDAHRVESLARERGLTCGVAMNLRFHPALQTLRRLVLDGSLGAIHYARVSAGSDLRRWHPGSDYRASYSARADLGGGVVRDSIHELDYLTWLLGPAVTISAEIARVSDLEIDVEDLGVALIRLASGALASIDLSYVDTVYRRGCLIVGALATARWDWLAGTVDVARRLDDSETFDVSVDVNDTYVAEMRDFLSAIQTHGAVRTSLEEGATSVRLADALLRSAQEGRRIRLK